MKKYFLLKNGQQVGPFSVDDLKAKKIKKTNLVWAEGMADWLKAGEVTELKGLFAAAPPPPPKAAAPPPSVPPPPAANQYQAPPPQPQAQYQAPPQQPNYQNQQAQQGEYVPKSGKGWIIAGYIFALMGGLIGLAIGSYLQGAKEKLPNGVKVKKFDDKTRKHGWIIIVISAVLWAIWIQMKK